MLSLARYTRSRSHTTYEQRLMLTPPKEYLLSSVPRMSCGILLLRLKYVGPSKRFYYMAILNMVYVIGIFIWLLLPTFMLHQCLRSHMCRKSMKWPTNFQNDQTFAIFKLNKMSERGSLWHDACFQWALKSHHCLDTDGALEWFLLHYKMALNFYQNLYITYMNILY